MSSKSGTLGGGDDMIVSLPNGISVRRYRQSDVKAIAHHVNNKNIWNNLRDRLPHPYTEADGEAWIKICQDPSNHVRSGAWTAETGSQGPALPTSYAIAFQDEAIGGIGLDFGRDIYFRTAELGYWLSEEHWYKGIMSAVVPAFVAWTWRTFELLVRLNGEPYDTNKASQKVLQKAGFVYEGRRPNAVCKNGIIGADQMWGALRPEEQ